MHDAFRCPLSASWQPTLAPDARSTWPVGSVKHQLATGKEHDG